MADHYVIAGASLAGATAAGHLRELGFDGDITLIGEEEHLPYQRPPLSKEYLRGEEPFEKSLVHPETFYANNDIELRLGERIERVDASARSLELSKGESVAFDKALIATGSRNRRPPIRGIELGGVFELRRREDCDRLREAIARGGKAVVVGLGFIGAEVAASLRVLGVDVEAIEPQLTPLFSALGEEMGRVVEAIHRDHGVQMHLEDAVDSFEGSGRVERVRTTHGSEIDCDFVVFGLGVEPVTDLVANSGIDIENGIRVDEYCETSRPGVFAAGDVSNHYHPLFDRWVRVEHWDNAIEQSKIAAANMLGRRVAYDRAHWFWSDQYEHNIQHAGVSEGEPVMRGSLQDRRFVTFYLRGGRLVGAIGVDRGRDVRASRRLIEARVRVDPSALRDEEVDLRSLMPTS